MIARGVLVKSRTRWQAVFMGVRKSPTRKEIVIVTKTQVRLHFLPRPNLFAPNKVQRGHRLSLKQAKLIQILKNNRRTTEVWQVTITGLHARRFFAKLYFFVHQLRNSCMGCRVYWQILFPGANTLWRQKFCPGRFTPNFVLRILKPISQ